MKFSCGPMVYSTEYSIMVNGDLFRGLRVMFVEVWF